MEYVKIAIIGGTGIDQLPEVKDIQQIPVKTEYGSVSVKVGDLHGQKIAFLSRHGENHSIAPGAINYRANIRALAELGVKQIFATACVGSFNPDYKPGTLVVLRQFIEFTKNRNCSFFNYDGTQKGKAISHVDVTEPYCGRLSNILLEAGKMAGADVSDGATYCCMEGPRYETSAEVKMLRMLGGDVAGHTSFPEQVLAREAEICYASIGIVSSMAAGIAEEHITAGVVEDRMEKMFEDVQKILMTAIELTNTEEDCWCKHSLEDTVHQK